MAVYIRSQGINQWPPGMFRSPSGQADLTTAIAQGRCYTISYALTSSDNLSGKASITAGVFMLGYDDPFDQALWDGLADHASWTDALYLHRLVLLHRFQGYGLTALIMAFAKEMVRASGRHFLRMDCLYENEKLRRFYGERCLGKGKGGLRELDMIVHPEIGWEFARFELEVDSLTK
ncbi:hypothetical protein BGZ93_000781 [Podila epicladia]|nr:hypothetical protein BGZ92_005138 [Podila epicladia]KAG0085257.1 hypothetical protein BGZ93_000781 [Podila epicladia]